MARPDRSALLRVRNNRLPITGSISSPVSSRATRSRASAMASWPVWVSLRPAPTQWVIAAACLSARTTLQRRAYRPRTSSTTRHLVDRFATSAQHDHFTITRNGRADVMLISVAEYESLQETLDLLSDDDALADLRQSREDFAAGDTFAVDEVRAELERRRSGAA
ncbi:type II toxin-antitoxin system Phd/YefM family antitoxin [Micromonosporaceae bacterium Da 78-11]